MFGKLKVLWVGFWRLFWKDIATANPEVAYEGALADFRERVERHTTSMGGVKAELNKQRAKLTAAQEQLKQADAQVRAAVRVGNKEVGMKAAGQRAAFQSQVTTLESLVGQLQGSYDAQVQIAKKLRVEYDTMLTKAKVNISRLRAAQAVEASLKMLDSVSTDDIADTVHTIDDAVEEAVGRVDARRDAIGGRLEEAAVAEEAQKVLAEDEWNRLKAEADRAQGVTTGASPSGAGGDPPKQA